LAAPSINSSLVLFFQQDANQVYLHSTTVIKENLIQQIISSEKIMRRHHVAKRRTLTFPWTHDVPEVNSFMQHRHTFAKGILIKFS